MRLQHVFERKKLEINPLEYVHIVDAEQDGLPIELGPELGDLALEIRLLEQRVQLRRVDPDRHDLYPHRAPEVVEAKVPPLGLVLDPEHAAAAGEEMPGVIEGVEADEVAVE